MARMGVSARGFVRFDCARPVFGYAFWDVGRMAVFLVSAPLGARARCTTLHCCFFGGWVLGGGEVLGGGIIAFLAGSLTRYALGLAATLSTLSCTVPCHTLWPSSCQL